MSSRQSPPAILGVLSTETLKAILSDTESSVNLCHTLPEMEEIAQVVRQVEAELLDRQVEPSVITR